MGDMNIIVAVACIFLWYFLFEKIIEKRWEKNLKVKVHCNRDYAYEGEELELVEEIENRKFLILPGLKVKFTTSRYWDFKEEEKGVTTDQYYRNDVFSVGGYERIRRVLPFTCLKRGYYILGDIEVFASNYFYTKEYVKKQYQEQWVYVFAKRVRTPQMDLLFKQMLGEVITRKRVSEDPFYFVGIRDYQTYDTMRQINWKASAKTGELKVNRLEHTAEQSIHIFVFCEQKNVEWDRNMEEYVLRFVATLTERFLMEKIPVSFVCNGFDVETGQWIAIGTGSGENHMRCIDEGIARIDLNKGGRSIEDSLSFFEATMKEEDLHIVISTSQSVTFQKFLQQKKAEKYDFLWVLPHYETEQVQVESSLKEQCMEWITYTE